MENEFVSYSQAVALKELGFNEPCFKVVEGGPIDIFPYKKLDVPIYQQAFRWFREKYGMHHGIGFNGSWYYDIDSMKNCDEAVYEVAHKWNMKTYEEAEQACLDKLIEIVKNGTRN